MQQRPLSQPKTISDDGPSAKEQESQGHLRQVVTSFKLEESQEEAQKREFVLTELASLCQDWVTAVSKTKKTHDYVQDISVAKVFTFGSYRLGTHVRGTDIDMLLITPRHIGRSDFFDTFYKRLQVHPKITELTKVEGAYVPIMKFTMDGVDIDLLYAQLQKDIIDIAKFDILDNRHLKNLDQKSVLSMNGPRVAAQILQLVPSREVYRQVLRLIKLWAKRRCIYSNVMGYLGGVSWAILVARVCQLYPNMNAAALVVRFFRFCNVWEFGWLHPIVLCPIEEIPEIGHIVWNPQYNPREKYDLMPIITPSYPAMNSTHNVSNTTFAILKAEFNRANEILEAETIIAVSMWKKLLKEKTFFANHKHFIEVKIIACTQVEDLALSWKGFVEAKIRTFVQRLEETENCQVFPNPNSISRIVNKAKETYWWIGLDVKSKTQYNMSGAVKGFLSTVRGSDLCESGEGELKVDIKHVKHKEIAMYTFIPREWKKRRKKKKGKNKEKKKVTSTLTGARPAIPMSRSNSSPASTAMSASATSIPTHETSLLENPKGASNPLPLNHVNGPIKGPPRPPPAAETDPTTSEPTNTPPSSPSRKRDSTPPSDQPPSKRPRLTNIARPQFDLDIDASKMLEWLTAVAEWGDYDWSNIVTEFEAMVQAFVHHLSSKMDNQECYRKVFSKWGWRNWKFVRPLKQKTFQKMAQDVKENMQTLEARNVV